MDEEVGMAMDEYNCDCNCDCGCNCMGMCIGIAKELLFGALLLTSGRDLLTSKVNIAIARGRYGCFFVEFIERR